MKRSKLNLVVAIALSTSLMFSSCIGSFSLTNKVFDWNKSVGEKWVNELVFACFCILPVYEISLFIDGIIINSVEFWSGSNPIAKSTKHIQGENGQYLVETTENGYTITNETANATINFVFDQNEKSWSIVSNGESTTFMTFVDDNHAKMITPNGDMIVELSEAGVMAYQDVVKYVNLALN